MVKEKLTYKNFSDPEIEKFLQGENESIKKIVNIEGSTYSNEVSLVIHESDDNKRIIKDKYNPFIYVRDLKTLGVPFYSGNLNEKMGNLEKYKIKYRVLRVNDNNGLDIERLNNGYKYCFYTESSEGQQALSKFFSKGGIDIYKENIKTITRDLFVVNETDEPLIQKEEIVYNRISGNYEFVLPKEITIQLNSIKVSYNGAFLVDDESDEIELLEDEEQEEKPKSKEFSVLKKFEDYYIHDDVLSNAYRIIFHKKLETEKKLSVTFTKSNRNYFCIFKPEEQYLVQKKLRMFTGIDFYDDVHKFTFDIETEGVDPEIHRIFAIGSKDNKKHRRIDVVNELDSDDEERRLLETFFNDIKTIKPAIISGYYSEDFDIPFMLRRAEILKMNSNVLNIGYNNKPLRRVEISTYKAGNETIYYTKTKISGINVIDIMHAVKKTQAINSEMKEAGLKYVSKFLEIAKDDRMYVEGNQIFRIWKANLKYIINNKNQYTVIPDEFQNNAEEYLKDFPEHRLITGKEIVETYLLDDLEETAQVDKVLNESTFMLAKYLPTSFERTATIGGAGAWNLLMFAWSNKNNLSIPYIPSKPDFTGGLSRVFQLGYFENIYKEDYAGLYPSSQLEDDIFPKHDVTNALFRILSYFKFTRDKYKKLAKDEKLTETERKFYDTLQLPIKILNNSNFGAFGSEYFYWCDFDCAERITCSGRQYLRKMIDYFSKFGSVPMVTDSVTYDTPVYIKYENNVIDIQPISKLFNDDSLFLDDEKLRDYEKKPYQILTRNGWKNIKYVYKHKTDKKIHTITTKNRRIDVTEDHSLFQNEIEIKPKDLVRNDKIDIFDLTKLNFSNHNDSEFILNEETAWLYGMFLGDGSATSSKKNKKYFSKTKNEYVVYSHEGRNDWKVSNQNLEFLERTRLILKKYFNIDGILKDHTKSSNVHNMIAYGKDFVKFFTSNFYTDFREKRIPTFILNCDNKEILKSFMEGFIDAEGYGKGFDSCKSIDQKSKTALAGLSLILEKLGKEYRVYLRKDKENITKFEFVYKKSRKSSSIMEPDLVWNNRINEDKVDYVYDVSTEDGTFVAGIGGVICHNTDGCNFSIPEYLDYDINFRKLDKPIKLEELEYTYNDVTYYGVDAMVEKFNNEILNGQYMKLDNDGSWLSTANFSRKNYANLDYSKINDKNIKHTTNIPKEYLHNEDEYKKIYVLEKGYNEEQIKNVGIKKSKLKYTGNSIKSKTMSGYIEEFIKNGIELILNNKGPEFIEYYYSYLTKIFCKQIPLIKIASKARIKGTISDYLNRGTDKNGKPLPKKVYMELIIKNNINTTELDYIYFINNGTRKSHSNSGINKKTGEFYAYAIDEKQLKENPTMLGEYNVAKYIDAFNNRIKSILTVFGEDIRNTILKDDPTKREFYSESQMKLSNFEKDSIEEFYYLEPKEVRFWNRTGLLPDKIFSGYKTRDEIKSFIYHDKFTEVETKLKTLGVKDTLKKEMERYENGDLILKMETRYSYKETIINPIFNSYIQATNVYLPLKGYKTLAALYKETKKFDETKQFYICRIKNGEPQIIKEV